MDKQVQRMSAAEYVRRQKAGEFSTSKKRTVKKQRQEWAKVLLVEEIANKRKGKRARNGETHRINYDGIVVGLNDYKSLSWVQLKKKIDKVKERSKKLLAEKDLPIFECLEVTVFHNTNFDGGNLAGTEKPFVDMFVELGFLKDDKKELNPRTLFEYAEHLPKGTIVFQVRELKGVEN